MYALISSHITTIHTNKLNIYIFIYQTLQQNIINASYKIGSTSYSVAVGI